MLIQETSDHLLPEEGRPGVRRKEKLEGGSNLQPFSVEVGQNLYFVFLFVFLQKHSTAEILV